MEIPKEILNKYEEVIGLEVHMQLNTLSKAYASDSAAYGAMPNSQVSVITLGHPGTLPVANEKVLEHAVKLGLACGCEITRENRYARKNYFYADLPKGYQITQDNTPICRGGHITIKRSDGSEKNIKLTRIHMEEDAGKSIHDQDPFYTLVDLNRAGVPLLEMVSEPEIANAEEAYQYVTEIRRLVRYLEICDGNMEEGSLRCDANISVRLKGSKELGNKVEVKNMNSIRNVQRAIEHEIKRQITAIESGETITQETRSFDAVKGTTFSMRSKEMAHDYRYFPEPDLPPVIVTDEYIESVKKELPALPHQLNKKFRDAGLSEYDAAVLTDTREIALYFSELLDCNTNPKIAANWVMGPVKSYLNERALDMDRFPLKPESMADLIALVESGKVSHTAAAQKIFPAMTDNPTAKASEIATNLNLIQESNEDSLREYVEQAIAKYPDKVEEYLSGKTGLIGLFMGEVMKLSGGKADPKIASRMVKEGLERNNS
jgi:aspartyl-tRNA(Asn)/glutamyl-tRNA(Gln) amidotransferase subunit B